MKQCTLLVLLMLFVAEMQAQLTIEDETLTYVIDFDSTFPGVNAGTYGGLGFQTDPADGELDADAWATTGWSDGVKQFGMSNTSGDHARGSAIGGVTVGGMYAFDIGGGNMALGIQPTASDWSPGTVTLKIYNGSNAVINEMNIEYMVYELNDQDYSSTLNLSVSYDNLIYNDVISGAYSSIEQSNNSNWIQSSRNAELSGLQIQPCSSFYIRWSGSDVGGSGSRDELAIDNITIAAEGSVIVCSEPLLQGSNFTSELATSNSIQASYAGGTADKYLVVQSTSALLEGMPEDGVVYSEGSVIGNGQVIQYSDLTSINSMGLTQNTTYYYYIFASNDICAGGPEYLVDNPLTATVTTLTTPSNYYAGIGNVSCEQLKTALHDLIDDHTTVSYGSLWTHYQTTDDHLNDSGSEVIVWDMYSDNPNGSENEFTFVLEQCGTYQTEGDCYNREHTFPKSWWGGSSSEPQYTDIFAVVPADGWVNGLRNSNPYGEVQSGTELQITNNGSKLGSSSVSIPGYTGNVFEPKDDYKGDLARGYFYMATRYEDVIAGWENSSTESAAVLDGTSYTVFEPWMLDLLISWHESDPIDQKELDRNEAIFGIQGNRNPFIDHPEYVNAIWKNCNENDSCTLVYTNASDGLGSLRYAIDCAMNGDTITFTSDVYNSTILLTTDSILIDKQIVIKADPADSIRVASITPQVSSLVTIFKIESCAVVTFSGFAIDGAFGPEGAAIRNDGALTLENMTLTTGGNNNVNSLLHNRIESSLVIRGLNTIE